MSTDDDDDYADIPSLYVEFPTPEPFRQKEEIREKRRRRYQQEIISFFGSMWKVKE